MRKHQKHAVLLKQSSFNSTLELKVLIHSLTEGDGSPSITSKMDQKVAGLIFGRSSKPDSDLQGILLSHDKMG